MIVQVLKVLLLVTMAIGIAASFAPLLGTDAWWIRVLDFPRPQIFVALLVLIAIYALWLRPRRLAGLGFAILTLAALSYHGFKLYPYLPIVEPSADEVATCPEDSRLSILSINVERTNRQAADVLDRVEAADPDLFLAMETNRWWDDALAPLEQAFPYHIEDITTGFFGIHLFSKRPLLDPEIHRVVGDQTPAVFTGVALPDGSEVQFIGIHPRPPAPLESASNRDRQMLIAAREAADSPRPTIIAGDFNAAPWERVFAEMLQVGRLLDPRIGRGFMSSYMVGYMPLAAWPLDHILFQGDMALMDYALLAGVGSDHLPLYGELCHRPAGAGRREAPEE